MRRSLSAVIVCALIGTGTVLGGSAASAIDAPEDLIPTLADALADAAEGGATDAADLADAVGLPDSGPGSLRVDANGHVAATVTFAGRPSDADLDAVRALATVDTVFRFSPAAAVTVDPTLLDDLADLPGIVSVAPVLAPIVGGASTGLATGVRPAGPDPVTDCRAFPSDAVGPLAVDLARETFGADGTGVTVGILSDSFDSGTAAGPDAAADVAAGVLPGPGNPCGYETPVTVLADQTGSGSDEGRAMAQLVHAIAPGAKIMFRTERGELDMAEGIVALAEAGADVIVDDIAYTSEPHFQQGVISAAISYVQAMGVAYYTSAGNQNAVGRSGSSAGRAIGAWETTAFRGTACPSWVQVPTTDVQWECLDFDPSGAGDPTDTLVFDRPSSPVVAVSWAEPVYGVQHGLLPQLYVDEGTGHELVSVPTLPSVDVPSVLTGLNPDHPTVESDVDLVILRQVVPGTGPAVWTGFFAGERELAAREHHTSSGADRVGLRATGHASDGSAIAVAAADWRAPDVPEMFTSPGASRIHFEPVMFGPDALPVPSPAYAQPLTVPGPQIAAVDGNRTSFFGQPMPDEDGQFFFGTSAAAPNAAAVHALALSYAPAASADEIAQAAFATAGAMTNPLASSVTDTEYFGAGLIDANALLAHLPPHAATGLAATALSDSSIAVEWDAVAGATGYRVDVLTDDTLVTGADTDAATTATTFTGVQPDTTYTVRLSAIGATSTGPAVSVDVTTPRPAVPAPAPPAPSASDLGPAAGFTATPATVTAGGTVTITGLPARTWVYGWLFSDPTALGWAWTGPGGTATLTVPETVPAGAHRLALSAADGTVLGWVGLQVNAPAPVPAASTLPRTGFDADLAPVTTLGALALLVGAALVARSLVRPRRAAR